MKREIATLGVGLALTGLTACEPRETHSTAPSGQTIELPSDPYAIAPADRDFAGAEFNKDTTYLVRLGKIAANTKLVLLNDADTYSCTEPGGQKTVLGSKSVSEYCPSTTTVVLTAGDINAARYIGKYHPQIEFLEAHELGHGEQEKKGLLTQASLSLPEHPAIEEQATCYAGTIMKHLDPADITSVEQLLSSTPMDTAHGTSQAQAHAFESGATTGVCELGTY